ncbi:MAG: esterase-like activity of phytase family protein [Planctomycetota bacterium]
MRVLFLLLAVGMVTSCGGTPPSHRIEAVELHRFESLPRIQIDGEPVSAYVTTAALGQAPFANPKLVPVYEGGFSGVAPVRGRPSEFWVISDRGPNQSIDLRVADDGSVFGSGAKYFPAPKYQQSISRVRVAKDGKLHFSEGVRLRRANRAVVGLPSNATGRPSRETAFVGIRSKENPLASSPNGYDFEGVQEEISSAGSRRFWTCDEYGPSIQVFDEIGNLLEEYVPGVAVQEPGVPRVFPLPSVLRHRRFNRGFEGLSLTSQFAVAILQSPFDPAGGASGEPGSGAVHSRLHRIVRLDRTTRLVEMFAYDHFDDPDSVGRVHPDMKVGDILALDDEASRFLVFEHAGSAFARLYRVEIRESTTRLDEARGVDYEAGRRSYRAVEKTLVCDLTERLARLGVPQKVEGMTLLDDRRIFLVFDNDYGFESDEAEIFALPESARLAGAVTVTLDRSVR